MNQEIVLRMESEAEALAVWHAISTAVDLIDAVEAEPGNSIPTDAPLYGQRDRLVVVAQRLDHAIKCEPRRLSEAMEHANALYVPCLECEGDGCLGPNPAEDGCKHCGGSGCEPGGGA